MCSGSFLYATMYLTARAMSARKTAPVKDPIHTR